MSDPTDPIEGSGITWKATTMGPAPNTVLAAFDEWWDANMSQLVFLDDSDVAHARAMFFASFLSGLSWAMHVTPTMSMRQYMHYREKYHMEEKPTDESHGLTE